MFPATIYDSFPVAVKIGFVVFLFIVLIVVAYRDH